MTGASLAEVPLFARLATARRVLISGAGGGFDVFVGLPLYLALRKAGKEVFLANLTFSYLGAAENVDLLAPGLTRVHARSSGDRKYFPELHLCQWLATQGIDADVYCLDKVGVAPLRAAYRALVTRLDVDAVVLVDGGTDILMRGDEAGLGTPEEDMVSLAAVAGLALAHRLVVCLGFGIDAFHGVCHAHFLENVASLDALGAFHGAFSLLLSSEEGALYRDAVEHTHARMPERQSIVNGSIVSALEGKFGDHQRTERTSTSKLFINPLMALYWSFDLATVAHRSLYLPLLERTENIFEVRSIIEAFRRDVVKRERMPIPV